MRLLADAAYRVARAMYCVAGVLLIGMMLIILADVVSRTVFGMSRGAVDFTFVGGIEMVSYTLLFMVLFTLPYAVSRGQVIVDLFTNGLSERAKGVLEGIYTLGFGLIGIGMTTRFIETAERVAQTGESSQDLLIPLTYIYGVTAFATAVLALRGVMAALQQITESIRAS
ncbi:TRAP transporter small permease [Azospirillum soli]|uniref:TRAP transporter small permease n=1 Tax=Azospirillum soli TaxID=1304799 RepID=UPI001AE0FFA5|nr:TRAP transporter small permease subunit [Azospirillum soli]MBP2315348.1 TRAP-type C4-dicarboxylate transport system permease small subunit [Azospirillum soli]